MARTNRHLTDGLYDYILEASIRDHPIQDKLSEHIAQMKNPEMQSSPDQGQFMGLLIKLIGAKKTLEMGVFRGYSSLVVAQALPEDGKVVACDISEEFTNDAKPFWEEAGVAHKIDLRIGPAVETLDALIANGEAGTFDFAFIDADKDNYPAYYERSLNLLNPNGIILIDNSFMGGRVVNATEGASKIVRDLNEFIKNDDRVDAALLSVGDGLYFIRKR